jgi:hypothetical protein
MRSIRYGLCVVIWLACLGQASAANFWGLTGDQHLVRFTSTAPGTILLDLPITGVPAGEHIIAIQQLLISGLQLGQIVGVSSAGHTYALDRRTGVATLRSSPFERVVVPTGTAFGLSEWGSGLVLVSNDGTVYDMFQGLKNNPWPSTGHWTGVAISVPGDDQFLLDTAADVLQRAGPTGTPVTTLGPLGVDASDQAGLDIDVHDGTLFAALTVGGAPGLYTLDKTNGHAALLGLIGAASITSLTIDTQAYPLIQQLGTGPVIEGNRTIEFQVTRTGDDTVAADYIWDQGVPYSTPLATAGVDYVITPQTVHFEPGETEKALSVQILDDNEREPTEYFGVRLQENNNGIFGTATITIVDDDNKAPTLTITSPASPGTTVSTPTITLSGTFTDDDPGVIVDYNSQTLLPYFLPDASTMANPWTFANVPLKPGFNQFRIRATDKWGLQTESDVQVWRADVADQTFVFAEGATGGFFHTDLLFANPNFAEVPITIDFMREDGVIVPKAMTLPAASRTTLDVGAIPGLEATATAAVVHTNGFPIVAERTMTWDKSGYGASGEKGASALSTTWLFAEGSQGFFKTFLLLVNPQAGNNEVMVRFLLESGTPVTKTYTMTPHQRLTVDGAAIPEVQNQSFGIEVIFSQPGVAERSMYFGDSPLWTGGHESAGAPAAASDWFLAEGATGPFFETFLLLANPGSEPADVTMTYLPASGVPVTRTKQVPANGRLTVNIEFEDPSLENAAVATHVTSSKPIVVERSQYWPYTPDQWYETHNSFGQTAPGLHWGLAEGRVGGPQAYQTYILLANPQTTAAVVTVRFLRDNGGPVVTKTFVVQPTSRFNLSVDSSTVPEFTDAPFGVDIISSRPIMVERSMYSNAIGQTWAAGTNATATRLP